MWRRRQLRDKSPDHVIFPLQLEEEVKVGMKKRLPFLRIEFPGYYVHLGSVSSNKAYYAEVSGP
jgi:hypothetical protein